MSTIRKCVTKHEFVASREVTVTRNVKQKSNK